MNDWNDLIIRYLSGNASAEETERLNQWLGEDEKNLRYFFRYKNIEDTCHPAFHPSSIDTEQALRRVCPQAIRRRFLVHLRNIAAVAILLVTASVLVFRRPSSDIPKPIAPAQALQQTPNAILVLPSGEKIVLGGQDNQTIYAQGVAMAQADNRSIHYTDTNSWTTEVVYHELQIPRGGKFSLTLSDGSRIWLNADTKVRYPLHFAPHERKIFIEGEAYLQVAPMKTSPFKAITPQCEISVLGTHFNV
ncbi:MAG: FecR domain-containing protein, partial [Odoribacter sp.]|nr:FecR domain-containing protein [Odoribacter sp.]